MCIGLAAHLVKVEAAPLCSILSSMPVKHRKEALAAYSGIVVDERVGVLHGPPLALIIVAANAKEGAILEGDLIQFLCNMRWISRAPNSWIDGADPMSI